MSLYREQKTNRKIYPFFVGFYFLLKTLQIFVICKQIISEAVPSKESKILEYSICGLQKVNGISETV